MRAVLDTAIRMRIEAMVADCGLDSASIFFCDRRAAAPRLSYLHHVGVSAEAQYVYERRRVFEQDPFTRVIGTDDRCGRMIHWSDERLRPVADVAVGYRDFLSQHDVDVVGAYVKQVLPGLLLVLGAHRRSAGRHRGDVAHLRLQHEVEAISQMVVAKLLDALLEGGGAALVTDLLRFNDGASAENPVARLSPRERQIAELVGAGRLNKQVAFALGLSEFTVENHLRRIYRKLGVRNRAGMATVLHRGRRGGADGYPSLERLRPAR